jgi:hypothetical protein
MLPPRENILVAGNRRRIENRVKSGVYHRSKLPCPETGNTNVTPGNGSEAEVQRDWFCRGIAIKDE